MSVAVERDILVPPSGLDAELVHGLDDAIDHWPRHIAGAEIMAGDAPASPHKAVAERQLGRGEPIGMVRVDLDKIEA